MSFNNPKKYCSLANIKFSDENKAKKLGCISKADCKINVFFDEKLNRYLITQRFFVDDRLEVKIFSNQQELLSFLKIETWEELLKALAE